MLPKERTLVAEIERTIQQFEERRASANATAEPESPYDFRYFSTQPAESGHERPAANPERAPAWQSGLGASRPAARRVGLCPAW